MSGPSTEYQATPEEREVVKKLMEWQASGKPFDEEVQKLTDVMHRFYQREIKGR